MIIHCILSPNDIKYFFGVVPNFFTESSNKMTRSAVANFESDFVVIVSRYFLMIYVKEIK
jgi:hypothetical protein